MTSLSHGLLRLHRWWLTNRMISLEHRLLDRAGHWNPHPWSKPGFRCMPVMPALGRLRQEDWELERSWAAQRNCLKNKTQANQPNKQNLSKPNKKFLVILQIKQLMRYGDSKVNNDQDRVSVILWACILPPVDWARTIQQASEFALSYRRNGPRILHFSPRVAGEMNDQTLHNLMLSKQNSNNTHKTL